MINEAIFLICISTGSMVVKAMEFSENMLKDKDFDK